MKTRQVESDAARNEISHARIVLPVALCIWALGFGTNHVHIRFSFYEIAAQVLPVLLLAMAVEGRYFRDHDGRSSRARVTGDALLSVLVLGELCALAVVALGHDSTLLRGGVLGALVVSGAGLLAIAVVGPRAEAAPPKRTRRRAR